MNLMITLHRVVQWPPSRHAPTFHCQRSSSNQRTAGLAFLIEFLAVLALAPLGRAADPLDTWTQRQSGTQAALWGVTYGGGQFVAVGDSGVILTSSNGSD